MSIFERGLLFILLPLIAALSYPPDTLRGAVGVLPFAVAFFLLVGFFLLRGKSLALTFTIFLQGMNVIVRILLFFSNAVPRNGDFNLVFSVFTLIGLGLSLFLLLRLDRTDIRSMMTA
jgi:hypothetical protein